MVVSFRKNSEDALHLDKMYLVTSLSVMKRNPSVTLRVQSLFFRTFGDKKYFFKAVSHINSVLTAFSRPSSLQSLYGPGTRQGRYIYY